MTNSKTYNVISTGSKHGNCEILKQFIMIDCGVSFKKIKPYVNDIQVVFLSHIHKDHFKIKTLQKLQFERPSIRIACGEWLKNELQGLNNIDVLELNKWYNYGRFKVSIGKLYHDYDAPNCFFRFDIEGYKVFRATDTQHLNGITAKNYDLYAVEFNYDEEKIQKAIEKADREGKFCHGRGSEETHLSTRQAWEFINANKKENSEVVELHQSESFY